MSLTNASPEEAAKAASQAALSLARLSEGDRNHSLTAIHNALCKDRNDVLQANAADLNLAVEAAQNGELSQSLVKRLDLARRGKYDDMLKGILDVRNLKDPSMIEFVQSAISERGVSGLYFSSRSSTASDQTG